MAITKEVIWSAAGELDQAGEKPTLANVRQRSQEGWRWKLHHYFRSDDRVARGATAHSSEARLCAR